MKIIDLAEKQKNNEILPKHIRYYNEDLYFDGVTYYDKEGNNDLFDILAINNNALTHLYDKVEIIEEKKIPEKLNWKPKESMAGELTQKEKIEVIARRTEKLKKEFNNLLDYLKSKGDE